MFYKSFPKLISNAPVFETNPNSHERIGSILMRNTNLDMGTLTKALAIQRHHKAQLGQILLSLDAITEKQLEHALSDQYQLETYDLEPDKCRIDSLAPFSVDMVIENGFVPIKSTAYGLKIAISDPKSIPKINSQCHFHGVKAEFVLSRLNAIHACIQSIASQELARQAEHSCPERLSCRSILTYKKSIVLFGFILFTLSSLYVLGALQIALLSSAVVIFYCNGLLKLICFLAQLKNTAIKRSSKTPIQFEKVSVLVPLLREDAIIYRLIPRLQNLDYPKELLEICLICETDDHITRKAINQVCLPSHFKVFYTPKGNIKTKPRALNYALPFCTGEIITVYDAEDAPESDQIYKAVRHLNLSPENVTCVQARLDFFNQDTNWMSRCFTIEYATLFRVILQGLQRLDLPIPLGGTSMFVRKSALIKLGQWDAHNVTEDADLGIRLYRAGMRVECLDSITYEEANHRFTPWVKQRSRWLKGFFITWLSHMRNPRLLARELGLKGFLSFNILLMGTFITYLIIPLILPYWAISFGMSIPIHPAISNSLPTLLILLLIIGEPLLLFIGYCALDTKKLRPLRKSLPAMLIYWPMASLAAYKALFEIFVAPIYWDKTEHGISDANCMDEIRNLTNLGTDHPNV